MEGQVSNGAQDLFVCKFDVSEKLPIMIVIRVACVIGIVLRFNVSTKAAFWVSSTGKSRYKGLRGCFCRYGRRGLSWKKFRVMTCWAVASR